MKRASDTILLPGQTLPGTSFKVRDRTDFHHLPSLQKVLDAYEVDEPLPDVFLTSQDVTRWKSAWQALEIMKSEHNIGEDLLDLQIPALLLVRRCQDWPSMRKVSSKPSAQFGFIAATIIYGGVHALAWHAHFDTATEQLLWRMSACIVMGGLPVMLVLPDSAAWIDGPISHPISAHDNPRLQTLLSLFTQVGFHPISTFIPIVLVLLLYILARAYLVFECFNNLSHLPADVYKVPDWSAYFPHIS